MALKVEDNQSTTNQKTIKSKKRRKAAETLVHFVLDETGSMSSVRDATIDGFNEYVNGLRADKNGKYWMSLTKFDSRGIVPVYTDLPIKEVPDLNHDTYCPCSMTNLNDAIGETVTKMESVIAKRSKKCNVLIVVMTDGHENASVEWTADKVKNLIQKKEKVGWTVTFLGANMDAQKVGQTYAIRAGNTKSYSVQNMSETMRGLSSATVAYASTASVDTMSTDFFADTDDWTEDKSSIGNSDDSKLTDTKSVDLTNLSAMTITDNPYNLEGAESNRFNPHSKQDIFDSIDPDLLKDADDNLKNTDADFKPLDDNQEDTDNG